MQKYLDVEAELNRHQMASTNAKSIGGMVTKRRNSTETSIEQAIREHQRECQSVTVSAENTQLE
nr:unnamed protein product [Callosobruchus chinensis]